MKYPQHSRLIFVVLLLTSFIISCSNSSEQKTDQQYQRKIRKWHQDRARSLTKDDSWLALAGLYKISNGKHTFGADSSNDIVFPTKAAATIGTITKEGSTFRVEVKTGVTVKHDSNTIGSMQIQTDQEGEPTTLHHDDLFWYIIERRGTYYLRLKDTKHPNLKSFSSIKHFPITKKWFIQAQYKPFESPKTISIPDALGKVYQDSLYGLLEFSMNGKEYSISPLGNPKKGEELFVILGDQTNGESTYSGGRYIYVPVPNENGITHIDFNKAYNPPCVFTKFATCPLPPAQNRLDVAITAGEKMYNGN